MGKKEILSLQEPNETNKRLNLMYAVMIGVILALFIGFIGVIVTLVQGRIDSEANKQATYQSLRDEVKSQNEKIDALTEQVRLTNEQKTAQETDPKSVQ